MPKADEIIQRWEKLKSSRGIWDSHWQEVKDLVRPNATDFNRKPFEADKRTEKIFDGTAMWSLNQLTAGLHSNLTSPTSPWFFLTLENRETPRVRKLLENRENMAWLEEVSATMYSHYSSPEVAFNPMLHEAYMDLGAFGTACVYQDRNPSSLRPFFRTFPLADCWFLENADGRVDTVYRQVKWTKRQVLQRFGDKAPKKIQDEKNQEKEWCYLHVVYPRSDRDAGKSDGRNMPFASCWISVEEKEVTAEGGYRECPYHVPRWSKVASEIYGRGPGMDCLPDIKMVNVMKRTIIKAAQKIVDPPIIVADDGVILPLQTFPGALIYKTSGTESPEPLLTGGRVDIGMDMVESVREHIMRCFFVDLIRAQRKKERQSVPEVMDDRDEQNRMMAPMLGRLQSELLGPMLKRTYRLLDEAGMLPEAPEALRASGVLLSVEYISPAAKAQMFSKTAALQQLVQDLAVIAQFQPQVYDVVNTDEAARLMAMNRDVSLRVLRSEDEIEAIRGQRQQQAQMAQMAEMGGTVASGVKDLAQAQAALAGGGGA